MSEPKIRYFTDSIDYKQKMIVRFEPIDETWIYVKTSNRWRLKCRYVGDVRYNYDRQYRAFFKA